MHFESEAKGKLVVPLAIVGVGLLSAGLFFGFESCARFWRVDACLDRGGRYDYEVGTCDFGRSPPEQAPQRTTNSSVRPEER